MLGGLDGYLCSLGGYLCGLELNWWIEVMRMRGLYIEVIWVLSVDWRSLWMKCGSLVVMPRSSTSLSMRKVLEAAFAPSKVLVNKMPDEIKSYEAMLVPCCECDLPNRDASRDSL